MKFLLVFFLLSATAFASPEIDKVIADLDLSATQNLLLAELFKPYPSAVSYFTGRAEAFKEAALRLRKLPPLYTVAEIDVISQLVEEPPPRRNSRIR